MGAHSNKVSTMTGGFAPAKPSMLLYDGTNPDSKMVGLSYSILGDPNTPPEGFAGPNDPWHKHDKNGGVFMKGGGVVRAQGTRADKCAGGRRQKGALSNLLMIHAGTGDATQRVTGIFRSENSPL